jgi:hypothetical protein
MLFSLCMYTRKGKKSSPAYRKAAHISIAYFLGV